LDSADAGGTPDTDSPTGTGCTNADLGRYRLVFDSDGGRLERRIYSMRADGTELEALTPPGELAREPALSPDGSQLAYVTPEGIRLLTLATGESELLLPSADQPSWSPDGLRLFHRGCTPDNYSCGILAITLANRSFESFVNTPASSAEASSDGATLVFAVSRQSDGSGSQNAAGVQALNLNTPDNHTSWSVVELSLLPVTHPTLSPDGIWLGAAIQCQNEPSPSLWVNPLAVPTPACEGRRITPPGVPSVSNPKWGPGALIAYERGTPPRDLAIVAADTGEECVIPRLGDDRNPSWAASADFQPPQ